MNEKDLTPHFDKRATQTHWWTVAIVALVVSTGLGLAFYVNTNTTQVRKALATEVLQQQRDVAKLIHEFSTVIVAIERQWLRPSTINKEQLNSALQLAQQQLLRMRSNYSFERLDGATKAHAYAKPVLEDVEQWLTAGIPQYDSTHPTVYAMASKRLTDRYSGLRDIAHETDRVAESLINDQSGFLGRFRDSLILLLGAYALVALGIAALLIRQRNLQTRLATDRQFHAERFSDFAEAGADWFWETDADLLVQHTTGPKQTASGSTVSILDTLPPSEQLPLDIMRTKKEFKGVESRFRTGDGKEHVISMSGKPRFNESDNFIGFRGIGRDITLRKHMEYELEQANRALLEAESRGRQQAEQALRDSEKFLRTTLDALPEKMAILNQEGIIQTANQEWKKLTGNAEHHSTDSTLAKTPIADGGIGLHILDAYRNRPQSESAALQGVATQISEVLAGSRAEFEHEIIYEHPNNDKHWTQIGLSTFDSGGTLYAVWIHEDITERRLLEQHDRHLRTELAHAGRMATAGEMASGLAHELNQPLTAISQNCDALLYGLARLQPHEAALTETAQDVYEESQRAGSIIKSMRQLVRKDPARKTAVNLNTLVKETLRLTQPESTEQGVSIHLDLDTDLPLTMMDPVQIQQVLVNLERNAVEAIASAKSAKRALSIRTNYCENESELLVSVSDSGPGLDKEIEAHLFTAFRTTKQNGMGLGLSISRSIIEAHGGRLWIDGDIDGDNETGSTFHFTVPVTRG